MLACDYVLATDTSTFGLPEATRGLVPGFAAPLLARRCAAGFVNRMLMSGATVEASVAKDELMIDEIVKADLVWARGQQLVAEFDVAAPTSLQLTRQLVNQTISEHLFTQLSIGAANTAAARSTDDAKKGVEAFVNKTSPDWFE
jgi:enoyl-CoA hydratase/carnithine racemase